MKSINFDKLFNTLFRVLCVIGIVALVITPVYFYCKITCTLNPNKKVYKEFALISKIFLRSIGVNYFMKGKIPEGDENFIIVCDHETWIDVFLISAYFDGKPGVVFLDEKMFRYPIIRFFLRKVDAISINRKNEKGTKSALSKSLEYLDEKIHLFIFPQGTRRKDQSSLSTFHDGAAFLSIKTGKKILPLGLSGAYEFSNKKSPLFTPNSIVVLHTGELICPHAENTKKSRKELTEVIRSKVEECILSAASERDERYKMLELSKSFAFN